MRVVSIWRCFNKPTTQWEGAVTSLLAAEDAKTAERTARRHERIYKERQFTPIEEAMPLMDTLRWADLPQPNTSVVQPPHPRRLTAALVGAPNVGKSSLVNRLAGCLVAAEGRKAGTTHDRKLAVVTEGDTQLVFIDTPGIANPRATGRRGAAKSMSERSVLAWDAFMEADVVVAVVGAGIGFVDAENKDLLQKISSRAGARQLPVVLALSKMDVVRSSSAKDLYFHFRAELSNMPLKIDQIFETSSNTGRGIGELRQYLHGKAIPGEWKFAASDVTAVPLPLRVEEFVRQALFEHLPHQIPYNTRYRLVGWTNRPQGSTEVVVELFFHSPTSMYVFYGVLANIVASLEATSARELRKKFTFVLQPFVTPSGLR